MRNRNRKGPSPLSRSYESNGPDVKIRGTAQHIADKYAHLSRDAQSSGDRIMAENYLQHAEHYYRIVASALPQRDDQGRDTRQDDGDDSRNGERGYSPESDGERPGVNGHSPRMNGSSSNGSRHFAEAEQPDIVPPEHFERGGVENVPATPGEPAAKEARAEPQTDAAEDGDGAPPPRTRRRRAPRAARGRPRESESDGGQTGASDAAAGTASPAAETDSTPGEA